MSKERIAIFDIDGCISNDEWRRGRIPEGATRAAEYDAYHAACRQDPPVLLGIEQLEEHVRNGDFIAFLTARPMKVGKDTCEWLEGHVEIQRNRDFMILMRNDEDERASVDLKREQLELLRIYAKETAREIVVAYDDRSDVVAMYKNQGVPSAKLLDKNGVRDLPVPAREPGLTIGGHTFKVDGEPLTIEAIREAGLAVRDAQIAAEEQKQKTTGTVNTNFNINVEGGEQAAEAIAEAVRERLKGITVSTGKPEVGFADFVRVPSDVTDAASILQNAADTFRERNAVYKDNAFVVGQVMAALFPNGTTLRTAEDWHVYHLFELLIVKLTRFTQSGLTHKDSLRDLAVYAAMIESIVDIHNINTHQDEEGDL